jgi:hypothetical protein
MSSRTNVLVLVLLLICLCSLANAAANDPAKAAAAAPQASFALPPPAPISAWLKPATLSVAKPAVIIPGCQQACRNEYNVCAANCRNNLACETNCEKADNRCVQSCTVQ